MDYKDFVNKATVLPERFYEDIPTTSFLPLLRNGRFEKDIIRKMAADDSLERFAITPDPKYAYVLVISAGAGEWYGPNYNADFYNEGPCDVTIPFPCSESKNTLHLPVGLEQKHHMLQTINRPTTV